MKAVIVGLDFIYDSAGNLLPIEMNTNIGYPLQKVEKDSDVFDMTEFQNFITTNGFLKVTYIGKNTQIKEQIEKVTTQLSLEFESLLKKVFAKYIKNFQEESQTSTREWMSGITIDDAKRIILNEFEKR